MVPAFEPHRLDSQWNTSSAERNLELRLRRLELRATILEESIEHRLARLKAEIETRIWEDRLKGLFLISVVVAVVVWLRLIVSWVR